MKQDQIIVLLINFFRDEYADDPKGVGYWFRQNTKGSMVEFLSEIDHLKIELAPKPEQQ